MPTPSDYDGQQVPVILFPRFTTLLGQSGDTFTTFWIDVTPFESARITLWRGSMQGSGSPTVTFFFDESTDRDVWTNCTGTSSSGEQITMPHTELVMPFVLSRKWFRLRAQLDGDFPAATIWAQGFLIRRRRQVVAHDRWKEASPWRPEAVSPSVRPVREER